MGKTLGHLTSRLPCNGSPWKTSETVSVGVEQIPGVIKKASQKKIAKRSRLKPFIKVVNYNHIMPTRYTLDVDLKNVVTPEKLDSKTKKVETKKETKAIFEERFKTGKNRWFFSKLRF